MGVTTRHRASEGEDAGMALLSSSVPFFIIAATAEAFLTSRLGEWHPGLPVLVFELHSPDQDLVQGWGSGAGGFGVMVLASVYCNWVVPN